MWPDPSVSAQLVSVCACVVTVLTQSMRGLSEPKILGSHAAPLHCARVHCCQSCIVPAERHAGLEDLFGCMVYVTWWFINHHQSSWMLSEEVNGHMRLYRNPLKAQSRAHAISCKAIYRLHVRHARMLV